MIKVLLYWIKTTVCPYDPNDSTVSNHDDCRKMEQVQNHLNM